MKIQVTQQDISAAETIRDAGYVYERGEYLCTTCPTAQALMRTLNRPIAVTTDSILTYFTMCGMMFTIRKWPTPKEVMSHESLFEMGYHIQPFDFELEDSD